jgi:NADH-quinone oxidoreductase subunit K
MLVKLLLVSFLIFFTGLFGIFFYRRNFLIILICFEILLLSVNYNFVIFSIAFNDVLGQLFVLFIFIIAGVESAIGLSIFVLYYKIFGIIDTNIFSKIRG